MQRKIKVFAYFILKYIGVFWLVKFIHRKHLRILCYHGIASWDEHEFKPALFMTESCFRQRMEFLALSGYEVISLKAAVKGLKEGNLGENSVVITFDDGWEGIFSKALPILQQHDFPVTIYITSYYAEKQVPVLNVFLQYLFWKSPLKQIDLVSLQLDGLAGKMSPADMTQREETVNQILDHLEAHYPLPQRYSFCETIGQVLQVNTEEIKQKKMFMLAGPEMIAASAQYDGVDIELHTHRHVLPDTSFDACADEVRENQKILEGWTGKTPVHFCYPHGWYTDDHFNWLPKLGLKSAVTVCPGLNDRHHNIMALDRFLDGQSISRLEFEAELCGIASVIRKIYILCQ
ncbi:polysaccharide deacetylase family protein [Paremcibacter congregatus]|uniref:polysaccharide deacetylase family protein n=1 Tax=Paremcibacter congregatus TaxID=2043170 RepID=UPI0030EE3F42